MAPIPLFNRFPLCCLLQLLERQQEVEKLDAEHQDASERLRSNYQLVVTEKNGELVELREQVTRLEYALESIRCHVEGGCQPLSPLDRSSLDVVSMGSLKEAVSSLKQQVGGTHALGLGSKQFSMDLFMLKNCHLASGIR